MQDPKNDLTESDASMYDRLFGTSLTDEDLSKVDYEIPF